jgi:hypothetical protein
VSAPTAAERAQMIAGLRELADLLEAHPDLPVTAYPQMLVHAGPVDTGTDDENEDAKRAIVDRAAAILGTEATVPLPGSGHYEATWRSRGEGPSRRFRIEYKVLSITAAAMRAHDARQSYSENIRAGGAR